jgi:4a-hydroxytetrahydrobiopterin dehydratase
MTTVMSRGDASAAIEAIGWRYIGTYLMTSVAVRDLAQAAQVAAAAVSACGLEGNDHLRADLRHDRVELLLWERGRRAATARDVELAHGITDAVRDLGLDTAPVGSGRPVQGVELGIDALDIEAIRPFWRAVLGYTDEPNDDTPNAVVDPLGQGPSVWFQQMDEPRPQRNRIHFDLLVPHDEAAARIEAALAAGGRLLTDEYARSFWVLADPEGNEICVCTWQDRDSPGPG